MQQRNQAKDASFEKKMKKSYYLVAGLGQTGHSIAGYLHRRNIPFVVFDTRKYVERLTEFSADFPGVDVFLGDFPSALYGQISQIIASPGLSLEEPFLEQARRHNIPIIGDIECFAQHVKAPVVAITGTNGKSTVTALVGEMAKAAGLCVAVGGNFGLPVLDLLDDGKPYTLWVLELSSFQLELTHSLHPLAATILNITPDHLDRHHHLENYIQAKQRIYRNASYCLYYRDDLSTKPLSSIGNLAIENFSLEPPSENEWGIITKNKTPYLAYGKKLLCSVDTLKIHGKHNWLNALAACALATRAGIPEPYILHVLETFTGLPHRCQTVRTLNDVTWINDSKGTNVGATISAIEGIGPAISGKIILIAGGLGKGADFHTLIPSVQTHVREVVLIGKDAPIIAEALDSIVPLTHAATFEEAIHRAKQASRAGDVVLLSPACASMDMFKDYVHRGECFTELVNSLPAS